jgi:type IV secretory pathway VirD2 relaxase
MQDISTKTEDSLCPKCYPKQMKKAEQGTHKEPWLFPQKRRRILHRRTTRDNVADENRDMQDDGD